MNILWIAPYPVSPGQHPAPWICMLASELAGAGHRLTILTPSPRSKQLTRFDPGHGYEVVVLPYRGGIFHLLSLFHTQINAVKSYLQEHAGAFDIIHVHGTELQYASSLTRLKPRVPYIISMQGIISIYKRELKNKFTKRYLYWTLNGYYEKKEIRGSTHFFCRTHWDQAFVKKINKQADIAICWEVIRREFFNYEHTFSGTDILFMGGNNPLKALDHCLQVVNQVAAITPVKLHIVGFVDPARLKKIKFDLNLRHLYQESIILHGSLDAPGICEVYRQCFCLYHPSLIDNSPNSVCEAQVAGLPVVATDVGGVSSLIEDGITGFLVPGNDSSAHVEALLRLLFDDRLKMHISCNARRVALKRHDTKEIVNTTIYAYHAISSQGY